MVTVTNRQRRWKIASRNLVRTAETILDALGLAGSELAVTVVGDRTIRRLNRQYLGRDKATNVISFAMGEGEFGTVNPQLLGDVVISADTCAREAEEGGLGFTTRLGFLLLHGILHLAGYDHERSGEAAAARMEAKEQELFALLEAEGHLA